MFTGIVEEVGIVVGADIGTGSTRLRLRAPRLAPLARLGDSLAVDGCCLTCVELAGELVAFDAVPETLARTTLGALRPGSQVNLEDALRAGEPLGGHVVQGHVDGVGSVETVEPEGDGARLAVRAPEGLLHLLAEKGSIAVAGVSLTVAALRPGDRVNLESDVLARHVERLLAMRGRGSPARLAAPPPPRST